VKARWPAVGEAVWDLTHPAMSLWKPGMRAFVVPSHNMTGAIRINVKGREPVGMVEPGAEYEALCDELIAALSALENPETGRPAVQWVARARDLHRGRRLDDLPDLFVEWEHSAPINALRSERIGTVTGALAETRTGDHWHDGLLMAQGPPFRRGDVAGIRTEDLAPTVLDFLGVPSPSSFEGKSVLRLLTADAAPEPTGARPSVR
jgi:predicted AlkP superfamily phosphohydrolase/phosphomutase